MLSKELRAQAKKALKEKFAVDPGCKCGLCVRNRAHLKVPYTDFALALATIGICRAGLKVHAKTRTFAEFLQVAQSREASQWGSRAWVAEHLMDLFEFPPRSLRPSELHTILLSVNQRLAWAIIKDLLKAGNLVVAQVLQDAEKERRPRRGKKPVRPARKR